MSYTSKYTGEEIDNLLSSISSTSITKNTLWEGEFSEKLSTITLNDKLTNYDFLFVEGGVYSDTGKPGVFETVLIDAKTVKYAAADAGDYSYNIFAGSKNLTHHYRLLFNFNNETTIKLLQVTCESSVWTNPHICRVMGIRFAPSGVTISASAPIGSILPVMGMEAPQDYLVCDGRELNINEYKELANYFEKQFGSKNHFGGDGNTTFAVPDLRNDFLRGYGDKSNDIGIHQDATTHLNLFVGGSYELILDTPSSSGCAINQDSDTGVDEANNSRSYYYTDTVNQDDDTFGGIPTFYTSRPTNVAVLFCIKYTESAFSSNGSEDYSIEEKRIGTWIDGKPIYRKVYTGRIVPVVSADGQNNLDTLHVDDLNIDTVIHLHGRVYNSGAIFNSPYDYSNTVHGLAHYYRVQYKEICTSNYSKEYGGRNMDIIVEYTKTTD